MASCFRRTLRATLLNFSAFFRQLYLFVVTIKATVEKCAWGEVGRGGVWRSGGWGGGHMRGAASVSRSRSEAAISIDKLSLSNGSQDK